MLIADKGNCLGGTCTQGLVTPFMSTTTVIDGKKVSFAYGIFREIVAELVKYEEKNLIERYGEEKVSKFEDIYTSDYLIDDEYLKFLLNRMMQENGIDVLFHSFLSGANVNGSKIEFLTFTTKSGSVEISADYFIDASGDADLAYLAGCPYEVGRAGDGLCQPMSLGFRVGNVDVAGRCISTTHEAQASIRIIPIVSCLGEAAGTAVGIASKSGIAMRDVDVSALQDKLLKSGAILK